MRFLYSILGLRRQPRKRYSVPAYHLLSARPGRWRLVMVVHIGDDHDPAGVAGACVAVAGADGI